MLVGLAMATAGCREEPVPVIGTEPARPRGGEVVVQVLVDGGFLPVEAALATVPSVTVLGDGTVISPAPVPQIYPGPAITPLQSVRVDAATVDDLVDRARRLGLLDGPLELGRPSVMDAPTTTVTITVAGATHGHRAYALGFGDEADSGGGTSGLSDREVANRRALRSFVEATQKLPPGERPWAPSAVAVYRLGPYQPDPELPQVEMAWPLGHPPATSGSPPCGLVEGDDVGALLAALARANSRTPWLVDGARQSLAFRPVLPGQPGCSG